MENFTPIIALVGGGLIGLAATLLMLTNGRIAGISGIANGLLFGDDNNDKSWRLFFIVGLVIGCGLYVFFNPAAYQPRSGFSVVTLMIAGLLVGFGTRLGNGCTSGHGVCGLARLSVNSLIATLVFLGAGMLTVFFMTNFFGT